MSTSKEWLTEASRKLKIAVRRQINHSLPSMVIKEIRKSVSSLRSKNLDMRHQTLDTSQMSWQVQMGRTAYWTQPHWLEIAWRELRMTKTQENIVRAVWLFVTKVRSWRIDWTTQFVRLLTTTRTTRTRSVSLYLARITPTLMTKWTTKLETLAKSVNESMMTQIFFRKHQCPPIDL